IKRRAARACQSCRTRKVRCDIVVSQGRCTNCKLDNLECILLSSKRGKNDTTQKENTTWLPPVSPASTRDTNVAPPAIINEARQESAIPSLPITTPLSAASASESTFTGCYTSDSSMENDLPSFIKPLPTNIDPEDLKYLARKGAFIVPAADLRAEILRSYVFTVYPFMPILDLKEFVDIVLNPDSGGKVSLLLFQAVMFAGLSSLKQEVIQHTGCKTLKQARKTFFTKVLSLYDLGIERQDTVVLQSLLLMSLWYEKWDDRKHTWHWTGLALSLAQSMGLNRGAGSANLPPKVRRLRRRIWWSLYIRDRLIALGTRRSMRIKDEDYDVPLLAIEDFDIEPLNGPFGAPSNGWLMGRDANQSRGLTLMCIELSRLCICIGHVLQSQYTTLGERSPLTSTLMVVPKSPYERAKELTNRDNELEQWYQGLDPQIQNVAHDSPRDPSTNSLGIHWSILQVIHQTAVSILHRPQILEPCPSGSEGAQAQHLSREKVGNAARKITKIMHAMLRRDQVRFLPTSGLTALLSASLGHMLEIKSNDENLRDASIFRFYQTMQVLQRLREIYAAADSAVSFLASAVRKAGISAPIQL
ncbi:fungal-specific transcription factor domain-containing protein, partial [Exophiala viscosa]|uniref:fungal-specific transcription factor domain-containing protein n=1 Tax=Exophiala viscosa TaxID=2486360 RepID=UPI00219DD2E0